MSWGRRGLWVSPFAPRGHRAPPESVPSQGAVQGFPSLKSFHDLPSLLSRHISPPGPSPITHGVMLAPQLCQLLSKPPLHHMLPVGVGVATPPPCFQGRKHPTEEPGAADARPQLQDPGSQGLGPLRPARLQSPTRVPPPHTHTQPRRLLPSLNWMCSRNTVSV